LPFDSLAQLRSKLYQQHPHFAAIDQVAESDDSGVMNMAKGKVGRFGKTPFMSPVTDFYLTNPIARASAVMAECSALANDQKLEAAE
jgi:NADH-quinone oxidoreductase subunit G